MTPQEQQANFLRNNQGAVGNVGIGVPQGMPPPQQQPVQGMGQGMGGNMSQAMMQYLATLKPEEREAAIKQMTQDFEGQGAAASEQMARSQGTMDAENPQGRTVRDGIYVAANPLEHLATAMKKNQASKRYESAVEDKKKLSDMYGDSSGKYMGAGVSDYLSRNN